MATEAELLKQLAQTERQIAHGESVIDAQRRLLGISVHGRDVSKDKVLLDSFEQSQDVRHGELDRLLEALEKLPRGN